MYAILKSGSNPGTIQSVTEKVHRPTRRGLSGLLLLGLMTVSGQAFSYNCPTGTNGGTDTCVDQWPVGDHSFQNSWPTDAEWASQHTLDDYANDATYPSVINFLGDSANPGFYFAQKNDYLFFRVRVAWNGTVSSPTCTTYPGSVTPPTGCTTADPFRGITSGTIFIMIQKPLGTPVPQWGFAWDIKTPSVPQPDVFVHGLEMTKTKSAAGQWNDLDMDDVDTSQGVRQNPDFNSTGQPDVVSAGPYYGHQGYIRTVNSVAKVNGCDTNCTVNGATTFVDFAIACSYLTYVSGFSGSGVSLACGQTWNLQLASTQQADDKKIDFDVGANVRSIETEIPPSTAGLPGHITSSPTYSVLQKFGASVRGAQVLVEWDTQSELGTQGFELARLDAAGEFQPLHEGLISGQSPAGEGGSYRFLDPSAVPGVAATYRLTEVERTGNRRVVGQFPVTPLAPPASARATAAEQLAASLAPGHFEFTPRALTPAETERLQARRAERDGADPWGQRGLGLGAVNSAGPPANRAAIAVREAGLYQVSTSALAQALDWPEGKVKGLLQAGQLRLTNQGADIAWQAAAKDQGLLFYGEASRSIYDPENVYVVRQGAGTRMAKTQVRAQGPLSADSFRATVAVEENRFGATGLAKDPEEDYWFWSSLMNGGAACGTGTQYLGCGSRTFSLAAPEASGAGSANVRLWLRGASATAANPDHRVRVVLNGTFLGEGQWDGLTDYRLDLSLAGSLLHADGQNQLQILALADPGVPVAANIFYLDRLELDYPRRYLAAQDSLRVTGEPGTLLTVVGFTSPAIQVFDLSDPRLPRAVTGAKIQGGSGGYQVSLVPANATTPYLLVAEGAVRAPARIRPMETTGLAGAKAGAPYLVIAPGDFYDEATQPVQRLLSLRSSQGLNGRFVPLEGLYDEYGDGQKTPHAIRRFLAEAVTTWPVPPAYVLLAGKGTFDPKDYLGYGTDRLPVLMALTPGAGLIAADQRFVDVNADGIGDLAIGRLPAATAAEFAGMVDKLIAYEDAGPAPSPRAILVADGPDTAGNHTANSEASAALLLAAGLQDSAIQRLYLERLSAATVRTGLLAGLQGGADLLNYFGHAGVTALDHGLLSVADAKALTHPQQVPVMLGMTCLINRFEFPQLISLGEALMVNPTGGTAAVWSSGGYSYDASATALNDAVLRALLQQWVPHLGDAIQVALAAAPQSGELAPGVYNLLGDPATRNLIH